MQALGGQRRVQGLGDAFGGGGGIEARRAVAEIEGEGVGADAGCGADLDRARIAHRLGGLFQRGLQPLGEVGVGGDDQPRRGLDLAGQGGQRGLDGRLGELVERGGGYGLGAGQREFSRADTMIVRDRGQRRQRLLAGAGDLGQRFGLAVGDAGHGAGFARRLGGLADRLDLLGRIAPLGARHRRQHFAGGVEDRAEQELLVRRLVRTLISTPARRRRRRRRSGRSRPCWPGPWRTAPWPSGPARPRAGGPDPWSPCPRA